MLWSTQSVFTSEPGDSPSLTSQTSETSLVYQPLSPSVPDTLLAMPGAVGSTMPYVTLAAAVMPPVSVYEHDAVRWPIPSAAFGPDTADSVAAKVELPSSASTTLQVAAGTDPFG